MFTDDDYQEAIDFYKKYAPLKGTHDFQCYYCRNLFATLETFVDHEPCSKRTETQEPLMKPIKRQ